MQERHCFLREPCPTTKSVRRGDGSKARIIVVFRNDDPSACSDVAHERRCARLFDCCGFPQTVGVIPLRCEGKLTDRIAQRRVRLGENPRMVEFLCEYAARSGSEIALHGYSHKINRLGNPSRREHFEFEGLDLDEQEEMIAHGTQILVDDLGIKPCTFIAPWNRMDRNTVLACSRQGYKIISSGPFVPVVDGVVSLGMNCELDTFPSMFEKAQAGIGETLLVINYHSRYIREKQDFDLLEGALDLCAQSQNVEVLTLDDVVRLYPELVRKSNEAAINVVPQWQVAGSTRARVMVYHRALIRLGIRNELERTYLAACSLYWQGRYEETRGLSPLIDRLCNRLQALGRCVAFSIGAIVGILAWAISYRFFPANRLHCYFGALIILALSGLALYWHLTNRDARREILTATFTSIVGGTFGIGFGELVTFMS